MPPRREAPLRVLVVSPRFAPSSGADTHRLRLLLAHACASGWQPEVLCVDAADAGVEIDPWLSEGIPTSIPVHRVRAARLRGWGLGGLAQRSIVALYRAGRQLLATGRFDLVFFSTTEFALHVLGPLWKRKSGVPFCMDYQDPWVNDYYRMHPGVTPPGGRLKFAIADRLHRYAERYVSRSCDGYLAVSEAYIEDVARRYGKRVASRPRLVRPFPAEPAEFDRLEAAAGAGAARDGGARRTWRYVGRGGPDLARAATAFLAAWRRAIADGLLEQTAVAFEAIGTSYASAGKGGLTFLPLVEGTPLSAQVRESPDRLPYSDMLRALLASDALIAFGSDDPAYAASKIHPYLLSRRPLLAIFHSRSPVVAMIREVSGAACVAFDDDTTAEGLADAVYRCWFQGGQFDTRVELDREAFEPYTARVQARDVGEWLQQVVAVAKEGA